MASLFEVMSNINIWIFDTFDYYDLVFPICWVYILNAMNVSTYKVRVGSRMFLHH